MHIEKQVFGERKLEPFDQKSKHTYLEKQSRQNTTLNVYFSQSHSAGKSYKNMFTTRVVFHT